MSSLLSKLAGAAGILSAVIAVGLLAPAVPKGFTILQGSVHREGEALELAPGTVLELGTGHGLEVAGNFREADLLLGPIGSPQVVGRFGPVSGLYDGALATLGTEPRFPFHEPGLARLSLSCNPGDHRITLALNDGWRGFTPSADSCASTPLLLRANASARLMGAQVDEQPVSLALQPFAFIPAGIAFVVLGIAGLALGLPGWGLLLLTPLALLAPRIGLPAGAAAWAILATATVHQATLHRGGRRGVAALVVAGSLFLSVRTVVRESVTGHGAANALVQAATAALVDPGLVERKADLIVRRAKDQLARLPEGVPLLVALGSSSSGGNSPGRFWPQVLSEKLPELALLRLTDGGATTWHMRRAMEELDLHPRACVLYMGRNDTSPGFPGFTIAGMLRGDPPTPGLWAPPVSMEEAAENIAAIASRCELLLAVQEYVNPSDKALVAYAAMLETVEGVHYRDAGAILGTRPHAELMLDDVHPSPAGQALLAQSIYEALVPLLERP